MIKWLDSSDLIIYKCIKEQQSIIQSNQNLGISFRAIKCDSFALIIMYYIESYMSLNKKNQHLSFRKKNSVVFLCYFLSLVREIMNRKQTYRKDFNNLTILFFTFLFCFFFINSGYWRKFLRNKNCQRNVNTIIYVFIYNAVKL